MKKKKVVAWGVALTLLTVGLSGCFGTGNETAEGPKGDLSNLNTEGFPIVKEPIQLKMMGMHNSTMVEWDKNKFFQRMEEKTNIQFEYIAVSSQNYSEKKSLAFASGDLPDVFFRAAFTAQEETKYAEQGLLIPLGDYISTYAPNLDKVLKEREDVKKAITLESGDIVTLPDIGSNKSAAHYYLNQKWMDTLGLEEPETVEDFYNVLKAFKEKDPNGNGQADEIPFSVQGGTMLNSLMSSWGLLYNDVNVFVDEIGIVLYTPAQPQYKEALKFLKRLYSEGLMDTEVFTQTAEQLKAKGNQGVLGSFYQAGAFLIVGEAQHFDYQSMKPLTSDVNDTQIYPGTSGINRGTFDITNKNPYPEATMRWVDYLYTEEGAKLAWAGEENEDYKFNDDGTWDWILPEGYDVAKHRGEISVQGTTFFPELQPSEFWNKLNNPLEASLVDIRARVNQYDRLPYPTVYFSNDDQKRIAAIHADLKEYVNQSQARFITGDMDIDSEWDTYITTMENMGMKELVDIYQKRYDKYVTE